MFAGVGVAGFGQLFDGSATGTPGSGTGVLVIEGTGSLLAVGGSGTFGAAGIGSSIYHANPSYSQPTSGVYKQWSHNSLGGIMINSGTVTAIGGSATGSQHGRGAGIGTSGGSLSSNGDGFYAGYQMGNLTKTNYPNGDMNTIIINGGTVTATGGGSGNYGAAGIGFGGGIGNQGNFSGILVNGGTVTATGMGLAAGIGVGGSHTYSVQKLPVRIRGGFVTANSGDSRLAGITAPNGLDGTDFYLGHTSSGNNAAMVISNYVDTYMTSSNLNKVRGILIGLDDIATQSNKKGTYFWPANNTENVLTDDVTIPEGVTLAIPENRTLVVPEGITLTNYGTIENGGTISMLGVFINHGIANIPSTGTNINLSDISATNGTGWSYSGGTDGVYTLTDGADVTITGNGGYRRIAVAPGATVTITLNGVTLDHSANTSATGAPIQVFEGAKLTLILQGNNVLKGGSGGIAGTVFAGLGVVGDGRNSGTTVSAGTLTIDGTGSLTALGGSGNLFGAAGIGGSIYYCSTPGAGLMWSYNAQGIIEINGGTITAIGGVGLSPAYGGGAGIGSAGDTGGAGGSYYGAFSKTITINGGTITATGGAGTASGSLSHGGAGLGGGGARAGTVNDDRITINGGKVYATGAMNGAGIGTGGSPGQTYQIIPLQINGGFVVATGGGTSYGTSIGNNGIYSKYSGSDFSLFLGQENNNSTGFVIVSPQIPSAHFNLGKIRGIVLNVYDGTTHWWPTDNTENILTDDVTIPAGVTLTIPTGRTLVIPDGVTFTNNGNVVNNGIIILRGGMFINGWEGISSSVQNKGTIDILSGSIFQNNSYLDNTEGCIYLKGGEFEKNDDIVGEEPEMQVSSPNIMTQPVGADYALNDTAVALTVTANSTDDGILSYQWYKNIVNSTTGGTAVGTNSNSYVPTTSAIGTFYYYCVITNTLDGLTATARSIPAAVTVSGVPVAQAELSFRQTTFEYGGSSIDLSSYLTGGNGTGAVTYSVKSVNNTTVSITGGSSMTITKAGGTVTITITKAASPSYLARSDDVVLTINKCTPAVYIDDEDWLKFGDSFTIYSSTSGNGIVTYSIVEGGGTATGVITDGDQLSISDRGASGTIKIRATAAETDLYAQATADWIYTFAKADQAAITFDDSPYPYTETLDLMLRSPGGGNGEGTFSFSIVSGDGATLNGSVISLTKISPFCVKVTKAADNNYNAKSSDFTIVVLKGVQEISIDDAPSDLKFGDEVTLSVTGSKGTVTYEIVSGGTATGNLTDGKLTITDRGASGTVKIRATAAATDLYGASGTVEKTFTFAKADQAAITFDNAAYTYSGTTLDISSRARGGDGTGAFSFRLLGDGAVLSGSVLTFSKAGTVLSITVTKAADNNYNEKKETFSLSINKGTQNVSINDAPEDLKFGDSLTLSATGNIIGAVSYEIVSGGTATGGNIADGKLTITDRGASGTIKVKATAAADDLYAEATAEKEFTFAKAYQSAINFDDSAYTYSASSPTLDLPSRVTGGSGTGALSFSVTGEGAVLSGSVLTFTKAGTELEIRVTKAADNNYNAISEDFSIDILKGAQTVSVSDKTGLKFGDTLTLSATGTIIGAVSYEIVSGGTATGGNIASGNKLTIIDRGASGTVKVKATAAATDLYLQATADRVFTFAKAEQTAVTFNNAAYTYSALSPTLNLSPLAGGGKGTGAFSFTVEDDGAALSGTVLSFTKAGMTLMITVTKAADNNYNAKSGEFSLVINKGVQSVNIGDAPDGLTFGDTLTLSATDNIGTVTFAVIGGGTATASIANGNELRISDRGASGTVKIRATAAANDLYAEATAEKTFTFAKAASAVTPVYEEPSKLYTTDVLPELWYNTLNTTGTIAWDTPYVIVVGEKSYSWTFTPNNNNYAVLTGSVSFTAELDELSDIEIITDPDKMQYVAFETLDLAGLVVEGTRPDGEKVVIPNAQIVITYPVEDSFRYSASPISVTLVFDDGATEHEVVLSGITVGKASYTGITHVGFTGTYSDSATLGADFAFAVGSGFVWVDPTTVPSCGDNVYGAKYNLDPENYNDFLLNVSVDLEHLYESTVVDPTCTESGYTEYVCACCDDSYRDMVVPATEHDFVLSETIDPDYDAQTNGYDLYTCENDPSHTERRNIVAWQTLAPYVTVTVVGGTISGEAGTSADFQIGTSVTVTANAPAEGKRFANWNDGTSAVSTSSEYTFTVAAEVTLTAVYEDAPASPGGDDDGGSMMLIVVAAVAVLAVVGIAVWYFVIRKP